MHIPKKNKTLRYRTIYKPDSDNLLSCLKILKKELISIYSPPDCVHGFIPKKNIKTNAQAHLSKKQILSVDIKSFFETITQSQIINSLNLLGLNSNVS